MEQQMNNKKIDFSRIKVGEIVADNYQTAELFQNYGIDFCCNGSRLLEDALMEKEITKERFVTDYNLILSRSEYEKLPPEDWDQRILIKHIVNVHHAYVKSAIPLISDYLEKVVSAHGKKYGYLDEIKNSFLTLGNEMNHHMIKEETILFPLIKYLKETEKFNERPKTRGYGTIKKPIKKMEEEHITAGVCLGRIRLLSNNYTLPADACNTFKTVFEKLKEFEADLFRHIHLENNILFPGSILLEEKINKLHN